MTGADSRVWFLEVSEPGRDRRHVELRGRIAVGSGSVRAPEHGLVLADPCVADLHLVLDGRGPTLVAHELGRGAPVTIDGVAVVGSAPVPEGSAVEAGDCTIRVLGWV